MSSKLHKLINIESKEIRDAFEKASIEGEGTPQEVADRREKAFIGVIQKYFPFPFRITKGNIIDSYGNRSNSIDCIILDPCHPYTIDSKNNLSSVILADGVDYAIEIKPDLSDKRELHRSLSQIRSVKRLRRLIGNCRNEHCIQIPTFIFSTKISMNINGVIDDIVDYYIENGVPKEEFFDCIIVNGFGLVINTGRYSQYIQNDVDEIVFLPTGEDTFMYFIMLLNTIPRVVESSISIIYAYIYKDLGSYEAVRFSKQDAKLRNCCK